MSFPESKIFLLVGDIVARLRASIWRGWKVHLLIKFVVRAWNTRGHRPQAACAPGIDWFEWRKSWAISAIQTPGKCNHSSMEARLLMADGFVARLTTIWHGKNVHRPTKFTEAGRQADKRAWSARSHWPQAACAPGIDWFEWWKSLAISTIQTFKKCDYDLSMKSKPICRTLIVNHNRAMVQGTPCQFMTIQFYS